MNTNDQFKMNAIMENMTDKRKPGRPVVEGSARQLRMQMLEQKKADPNFRLGRPVDPDSPRQQRLRDMEERRAAGLCKRGRPKFTDEQKAAAEARKAQQQPTKQVLSSILDLDI